MGKWIKKFLFYLIGVPELNHIDILHLKSGDNESKSWKELKLHPYKKERVELTKDFLDWNKFGFKVKNERFLAPINELTKLLNDK